MLPVYSAHDTPNRGSAHTKLPHQLRPGFGACSYNLDLVVGQLRLPVRCPNGLSPFLNLIGDVFVIGADKEMPRINTRGIVAGMANVHPLRNLRTVGDLPAHAMGSQIVCGYPKLPVPRILKESPEPLPTIVRTFSVHLRPKAKNVAMLVDSHLSTSLLDWSGVAGGLAPTATPNIVAREVTS